jgi:hypothetical protein
MKRKRVIKPKIKFIHKEPIVICIAVCLFISFMLSITSSFTEPKFKVGECIVVRSTGKAGRVVKVTFNATLMEYSYELSGCMQPIGFLIGSNIYAAPDSWCGE